MAAVCNEGCKATGVKGTEKMKNEAEKEDFLGLFMLFRKSLSDQTCCPNGKAKGVKGTEKISHE